jgi:multicomponent Na+:H+ antiporter subunit G
MGDLVAAVLVVSGALLVLLAAVGVNRFDDVYARMHAATKAATLGLLLTIVAAILRVDDASGVTKLLIVIALQLITAPLAAHMVGRAAYRANGPSEGTVIDELADADRARAERDRAPGTPSDPDV